MSVSGLIREVEKQAIMYDTKHANVRVMLQSVLCIDNI